MTAECPCPCVCLCPPCPPQPRCSCFAGRALTSSPSAEGATSYLLLNSQGTSRAVLLAHFHLPVENIPQGFILGLLSYDLSLGSCRGGRSWGSSLGRDSRARAGAAGRAPGETRALSEANPSRNPSRAREAAEPRRSPGLWEAGVGLGFPARKPVASWLLIAPTVT